MALDDSYTVSLLHLDGADSSTVIVDESGKSWATIGNAQIDTAESKFGGSSLLLDGTGDYIATGNSSDFDFGTGDWSIDCWIQRNGTKSYPGIITFGLAATNQFNIRLGNSTNIVNVAWNNAIKLVCNTAIADLTWTHILVERAGDFILVFVDGVLDGSVSCAGVTFNSSGIGVEIGRGSLGENVYYWKGWIDEVRISKGISRTGSGSITVPTGEYSIDGDHVLLHMNGDDTSTTFTDEDGRAWTAAGSAQLDTADKKFGSASGLFASATSDEITSLTDVDFNLSDNDFTIDYWVKTTQTTQYATHISKVPATWAAGMWTVINNYVTAGDINFYAADFPGTNVLVSAGGLINTGNWTHVVIQREGVFFSLYVNGVLKAARVSTFTIGDRAGGIYIGGDQTYNRHFNGWLDEVRFINGTARYPLLYTVPTAPYITGAYHQAIRGRNRYTGLLDPRLG